MNKVGGKARSPRLLRASSIAVALSIAANAAAPAAGMERDAPPPRVGAAQFPAFRVADETPAPAASSQAAPTPQPAATPAAASDKTAQETVFWESAERSNSIADYKAYLSAFPNGVYAPLARNRISAIEAAPAPAAAAQTAAPMGVPSAFGPPPAPVAPEALKAEVGTADTEQALEMGPPARMELQVRLKALGLYAGPIDGDLGPGVRGAIIEWQKRHEVAPTGELGPLELAALRIESEPAYQQIALSPPPVVRPHYGPAHRVIYSEPRRAEPPPGLVPVLGILGGIGLGVLGARLGGGFGGKGARGGKSVGGFGKGGGKSLGGLGKGGGKGKVRKE